MVGLVNAPPLQTTVCKQAFVNREQAKGAVLDIAHGETVEAELVRMIEKRARKETDPDAQEELWKASVRAYNASREAERRAEWASYHADQATRLRRVMAALVEHHEGKARQLSSEIEGRESA
jgi:hypothetical protein